jgi:hypothetical protein
MQDLPAKAAPAIRAGNLKGLVLVVWLVKFFIFRDREFKYPGPEDELN